MPSMPIITHVERFHKYIEEMPRCKQSVQFEQLRSERMALMTLREETSETEGRTPLLVWIQLVDNN
jgi:uncharacterized membrane protein (DUF106 family)